MQIVLDLGALPLAPGVEEVAAGLGVAAWQLAAGGGEDYEPCFCVKASERERVEDALAAPGMAPVSWIGEVREGPPGLVSATSRAARAARGLRAPPVAERRSAKGRQRRSADSVPPSEPGPA